MKKYIILGVLQTGVLGAWLYLQTLSSHTTIWNYWFNLVYGLTFLLGGFFGLFAVPSLGGLRSTVGKGLFFTSLGVFNYGVGQCVWFYYNLVGSEVPYPSFADVPFVLLMPLLLIGIWYIVKLFVPNIKTARIIEFSVFTAIILALMFMFINKPDVVSGQGLLTNILNVYYPFADAVIFSLSLITLRMVGGKFNLILVYFTLGTFLHAVADILFTHSTQVGVYWNGDLSDLLFAMGGFFLSLGIIALINLFKPDSTQPSSTQAVI